jgi:hypothetical protein
LPDHALKKPCRRPSLLPSAWLAATATIQLRSKKKLRPLRSVFQIFNRMLTRPTLAEYFPTNRSSELFTMCPALWTPLFSPSFNHTQTVHSQSYYH